ncbi:MAG: asparagine synthase (glutamine-hydrolyzing) [Candidatus Delongbacteria bacterium]|nr:asparagine synthase (glutamine-hydrolyzing) [Candidatus Delongbacteria bacterium]MBN2836935.1 asparagine synthase (glutamine-hydrolyzing) [Candidatus Delongbacteria bacterium]
MCGIGGIFSNKPINLKKSILALSESLKRRGPDDEGFYFSKNNTIYSGKNSSNDSVKFHNLKNIQLCNIESELALVHRRLSIIDLSPKGFQPMVNEDIAIVYNGEIFNYIELREELSSSYNFSTNSDTEVIIAAYRKWGIKMLDKFDGMFAIALYDKKVNHLFLIRDHYGIKPLFYNINKDTLIFASDIKSLISTGLVNREINLEQLWINFSMSVSAGEDTLLKNIKFLQPGTFLKVDLNSLKHKIHRYYKLPTYEETYVDENEVIEILHSKLSQSVRLRMRSDVEVASFMSGGIDSSLITYFAKNIDSKIKAYTLGLDNPAYDETYEAKQNAKLFGINHIVKRVDSDRLISSVEDVISCFEEPYISLSPGFIIAEEMSKDGIKVTLSGLGGDELFFGYNIHEKHCLLKKLEIIPRSIVPPVNKRLKKLKGLIGISDLEYYRQMRTVFDDQILSDIFNFKFNSEYIFYKSYENISRNNGLKTVEDLDLIWYLGKHQLYRDDQFMMHFSMEGRFPFLSKDLIELSYKIPHSLKLKDKNLKYLLKKIAQPILSRDSFKMSKKGFVLPISDQINKKFCDYSITQLEELKTLDIVNTKTLNRIISSKNIDKLAWQLVSLNLWYKLFIKS